MKKYRVTTVVEASSKEEALKKVTAAPAILFTEAEKAELKKNGFSIAGTSFYSNRVCEQATMSIDTSEINGPHKNMNLYMVIAKTTDRYTITINDDNESRRNDYRISEQLEALAVVKGTLKEAIAKSKTLLKSYFTAQIVELQKFVASATY